MIRDPAMLSYLNNNASRKPNPNENLARELMELFTLGEGKYTEQDVKNAARALTGYSYSSIYDQRYVFKRQNHDTEEKTIFGKTGRLNGDDLVDLILTQPAAGSFIAAKFWRMLIGEIDSAEVKLAHHAFVFRQSDFDIKTLYRSILDSEDFWHEDNRTTLVKSPASLTIGTIRSTGKLPLNWENLAQDLGEMGQSLFERPNVAGWRGGMAWITPARLLSRKKWLKSFTANVADKLQESATETTSVMYSTMKSDSLGENTITCLLYTSPSPRDQRGSRMPSSA